MKRAANQNREKARRTLAASGSGRRFSLLRLAFCAVLPLASTLGADGAASGSRPELCRVAALRNGFTIRYARQETTGLSTRLWVCEDGGAGYVEVPSEQIEELQLEQGTAQSESPAGEPETEASSTPPATHAIGSLIAEAASRYRIDPDFVSSVVKAESGFNPMALSPKGARGLMQLMPLTAASLGIGNPFDPAANVEGGTKYLRQLLDNYSGDAVKALAAYNAGPRRVEQYGGVPPYRETRSYVARIIEDYNRKKIREQAHPAAATVGQ